MLPASDVQAPVADRRPRRHAGDGTLSIPCPAAQRLFGEAEAAFDKISTNLDVLRCELNDAHTASIAGILAETVHHLRITRDSLANLRNGLGILALAFRGLRTALEADPCPNACGRCHGPAGAAARAGK